MEEMKKEIKVKFTGFWKDFDETDNFIINILNSKFQVSLSEEPEYLFYSVFDDEYIKYDCVRIFITGENICPDFQMCDYAIGFEYMEFGDRYLRCPFYYFIDSYENDVKAAEQKHLNIGSLKEKTEFCSFVYSNEDSDEIRTQIFEALSKYKPVNSGGKVLNSYNGKRVESKVEFERKHKFSIACENSSHSGYTTEKLIQSFAAGTVPIYWGDPDIGKVFNKAALIDVRDFSNLEELVDYVEQVDQKEELFLKYLQEPAFSSKISLNEMRNCVSSFILHICAQPLEQAFRRNRVFWGKAYQRRYWVYKRSHGFVMKLKKILGKRFVDWIEGTYYE